MCKKYGLALFFVCLSQLAFAGLAGSKSALLSDEAKNALPKISRQEVYDNEDWFIYRGFVYNFHISESSNVIPQNHRKIFDRRKQKDSVITERDVQMHEHYNTNALEIFLKDSKNIVGILVD
jgi:hypothetical protein